MLFKYFQTYLFLFGRLATGYLHMPYIYAIIGGASHQVVLNEIIEVRR